MITIISLETNNNYLYISFKGNKKDFNTYINKVMKIPGIMWCKNYDCWKFPKTSYLAIKRSFGEVVETEKTKMSNRDLSNVGDLLKLPPYDYQKEAIQFALEKQESLLILPCGSGKTIIMIGAYLEAKEKGIIDGPGLIVVKASLKTQWLKEISKFSDLNAIIIQTESEMTVSHKGKITRRKNKLKKTKGKKDKAAIMKEISQIEKEAMLDFKSQFKGQDLYVMNYETLRDDKVRKEIRAIKPDFAALDEYNRPI